MIGLGALLFACAAEPLSPPLSAPELQVEVQVVEKLVEAGQPVFYTIEVEMGPDWTVEAPNPQFEGLLVGLLAEGREANEDRTEISWEYALNGEEGSYVLEALTFQFSTEDGRTRELSSPALYIDIGTPGPSSALADLAILPQPKGHSWKRLTLLLLLATLLASALFFWWRARRHRKEAPPPPVPADLEALRAWEEAWAAMCADDHALALELSLIFRRYLERSVEVRALSLTQREILDALAGGQALGVDLRERCQRLLSATDTLKFARRGGGQEFFQALDDDLRRVIAATRPQEAEEARV